MALEFSDDFESGGVGNWTSSTGSPAVNATGAHLGSYGMTSDHSGGSQWVVKTLTGSSGVAVRFYFKLTTAGTVQTSLFRFENPSQAKEMGFVLDAADDACGYVFDGTTTTKTTARAISNDTWYRLEAQMDWSGAAWQLTWGMAVGEAALTTYDTNFSGGLSPGADTLKYARLGGVTGGDTRVVRYDTFAVANTAAEYPLGAAGTTAYSPKAFVTQANRQGW